MTPHVWIRVDVFIFLDDAPGGEVNNREVIRLPRVENGGGVDGRGGEERSGKG